jgi:hypothetical protein
VELVLDRMRPVLRAGDLDGALLGAARDIGDVLAGRLAPSDPFWAWAFILTLLLALLVYNTWSASRRASRYRDVTRNLSKLESDVARARAARYAATSCPICMDDFAPDEPLPGEEQGGKGAGADAGAPSGSADASPAGVSGSAGGGGSAMGGADAPPEAPPPGLKKSLLPCGHAFCAPCLSRALAVKLACPICRAPPDGSDAPARPPAPPCNAGSGGSHADTRSDEGGSRVVLRSGTGADFETFLPELAFRLNRLHVAHPDVVTLGMVDRWSSASHVGGFTNDPALLRADPARQPPGGGGGGGGGGGRSGGSGSSFGGGSSSGGGGRGSSW